MTAMALVHLAEETAKADGGVPAWVFGLSAFAGLVVALFVVTRFNPDR